MKIFQPDRHTLDTFVESHAALLTGDVIDIGGRNGRFRNAFPQATSYRILDIDPQWNPDICASVEDIPLEENSVDGIACLAMLEDVPHVQQAIDEMRRILKPGGTILVTVPFFTAIADRPYDYWRFTDDTLRYLFADWSEIQLVKRGGYRSVQAQNWIRYAIERRNLYKRKWLGHAYSLLSTIRGRWALHRDEHDASDANSRFALGYGLVAKK